MADRKKKALAVVFCSILLFLVVSIPSLYRASQIYPIYVDSEVREGVGESVFFLRDELGLSLAFMKIKSVEVRNDSVIYCIHYSYRGMLDDDGSQDLSEDYFIRIDRQTKEKVLL